MIGHPVTNRAADLRGAARLAIDATLGVTDLVEAMHAGIVQVPGWRRTAPEARLGGLGGWVYRSVRGVTRGVGSGLDALLGAAARAVPRSEAPPWREGLVAALNGVLGDHLAATGNPLAIPMSLRRGGRVLPLEREALAQALPDAGPRLVVLLHGLCMNDLQWMRAGHDHGAALQRDLGYTPVYLHYPSGLHVSTNGAALARLMQRLVEQWPHRLQRLVLIGHSMGGLVARSALHGAREAGLQWPERLDDLVFLGTPHHGAPLERAGNWVESVLGAMPYAAPMARLGMLRSAGITDLRHGNLLEEDWSGHGRFARAGDRRRPLPLPAGVRCYALAATTGARPGDGRDRLMGDGLVPLASALGRHRDPRRTLAFSPERQWVGPRMGHLDLLEHPEVYAQLRRWLA